MTEFVASMRRVLGVYQTRVRDPDIEQAWLRIGICALAFGYVWYLIIAEGGLSSGLWMGLIASVGDSVVAGMMIYELRGGRANVARLRYLGILADNTALTIGMAGAGEGGVAMIGVYLWVTIGNGFRFGPRYLLASYWLSLVGFGLQLLLVPFWEHHRVVGVGLFLAGAIVPLYVLVLLIRLTGQKEAAEQLSNAKSRFVANVSHELRTPLTGVFAVYELLRTRHASDRDGELVATLGAAVRTLKKSVDAILQMSKLEAGAERAEMRPFNLWLFVHQMAASVRPQSVAKSLDWRATIDTDVPFNIVGDPAHLSHVIGNLLNNAFKFTTSGGVYLHVRSSGGMLRFEVRDTGIGIPLDQQERLFDRFVQVDGSARRKFGGTGLGTSIARDLTELMGGRISVTSEPGRGSIFKVDLPFHEPELEFEQIEGLNGKRAVIFGRGPLTRSLGGQLRSAGIEFDVRSIDDRSCYSAEEFLAGFVVGSAADVQGYCDAALSRRDVPYCPIIAICNDASEEQRQQLISAGIAGILDHIPTLAEVSLAIRHLSYRWETPDGEHSAIPRQRANSRKLSLLLADDNSSNRLLIGKILTQAGHSVQEAARGDQAFDALAAGSFDVALLDLNMPDMSGPDVIKLYRAASVGAKRLPIIILSADATPAAKQDSLEAGADEYLTKPVTSDALLAAIDRLSGQPHSFAGAQHLAQGDRMKAAFGQLIDSDQVQSLRRIARGDQTFLEQYLAAAFGDLEKAVSDLRTATACNSVQDARSALHIIEGTAGSLGATALVKNCKSMRTFVSVENDPDCNSALAELSTTLALTKTAIGALLLGLSEHYPDPQLRTSQR